MRVLHVIPSLSPTQGGPSMALPAMASALHDLGVAVDVATTDDDGARRSLAGVELGVPVNADGCRVFYFPKQTEFYKASLPLLRWLWRHVRDYDVVHIHAVFSFATLAAGWAARRAGVPFIVRPLGVLNRWGMENRRPWLKALSFRLLDKPVLDRAAAIHYTSVQERDEAAGLGINAPAEVLPLGFDLSPFQALPAPEVFHQRWPETRGRDVVLFLSRIDEKKGLDTLIAAFAQVKREHALALLVIAGSGESDLCAKLQALSCAQGVAGDVVWTGHLDGEVKMAALAAAAVFVLPSRSENFGIALLEAMAAGLPCVATAGVGLAQQVPSAVRFAQDDPPDLAANIVSLLTNRDSRAELGKTAREIACKNFSAEARGRQLLELYQRLHNVR